MAFEKTGDEEAGTPILAEEPDHHRKVDESAGWVDAGEFDDQTLQRLMVEGARGIKEMVFFCFYGRTVNEKNILTGLRRFISIAWMLFPDVFKDEFGKTVSLEKLADLKNVDCTKVALSLMAQDFGARWKFHARIQKRLSSKPNFASSAKTGWVKRRAREKAEREEAQRKQKKSIVVVGKKIGKKPAKKKNP